MNTLPLVKNRGRFSLVVYLNSWALPLHIDRVPGSGGWTYRVEILCFCFHWRAWEFTDDSFYDITSGKEYDFYDEEEEDIPF